MEITKEIIQAARVTDVQKLTSLTSDYHPDKLFSLMLVPKQNSSVDVGDVVTFNATLPHAGNLPIEVPVVVGDWSPIVFCSIEANGIDLTEVDAYVAPINSPERL